MKIVYLIPICLLIAACASGPKFDTSQVETSLEPRAAGAEIDAARGKNVIWGGVIIALTNLKSGTQVEVLAYPLDDSQRPVRDNDPLGRFLVQYAGFLEPTNYAEGRLVTVSGTVHGTALGKVGESDYRYPVVTSQKIHLWEKRKDYDRSNVHFGIGVGIGL